MDFKSEIELRQQLLKYHRGDISLSAFEDWFAPKSWNFDENAPVTLQSLVADVELLLAEYSNGDWTEAQLKQKLELAAVTYRASYSINIAEKPGERTEVKLSGSASRRSDSSQFSDIQSLAVYA